MLKEKKKEEDSKAEEASEPKLVGRVISRESVPVGVFNFVRQLTLFGIATAQNKYDKEVELSKKKKYHAANPRGTARNMP